MSKGRQPNISLSLPDSLIPAYVGIPQKLVIRVLEMALMRKIGMWGNFEGVARQANIKKRAKDS